MVGSKETVASNRPIEFSNPCAGLFHLWPIWFECRKNVLDWLRKTDCCQTFLQVSSGVLTSMIGVQQEGKKIKATDSKLYAQCVLPQIGIVPKEPPIWICIHQHQCKHHTFDVHRRMPTDREGHGGYPQ